MFRSGLNLGETFTYHHSAQIILNDFNSSDIIKPSFAESMDFNEYSEQYAILLPNFLGQNDRVLKWKLMIQYERFVNKIMKFLIYKKDGLRYRSIITQKYCKVLFSFMLQIIKIGLYFNVFSNAKTKQFFQTLSIYTCSSILWSIPLLVKNSIITFPRLNLFV